MFPKHRSKTQDAIVVAIIIRQRLSLGKNWPPEHLGAVV